MSLQLQQKSAWPLYFAFLIMAPIWLIFKPNLQILDAFLNFAQNGIFLVALDDTDIFEDIFHRFIFW